MHRKLNSIFICLVIISSLLLCGCIEEKKEDNDTIKSEKNDSNKINNKTADNGFDNITYYISWDYEQSPIIIESSMNFNSSTQLNISTGVEIIFSNDEEIEIRGNLIANGDFNQPIIFNGIKSRNSINIKSHQNSVLQINFCIFKNISISLENIDINLHNSNFNNSEIEISNGYSHVFNNSFINTRLFMTNLDGDIEKNIFNGPNLNSSTELTALGLLNVNINIIENSFFHFLRGICIDKSNCNIFKNKISNIISHAMYITNSFANISKNKLTNNHYGIYFRDGNAIITKNEIADNDNGIEIRDFQASEEILSIYTLNNNIITNNNLNIRITDASVEIKYNNISQLAPNSSSDSHSSIIFSNEKKIFKLTVNYNIITYITILNNISNSEKDFRNNYWDSGDVDIFYTHEDYYDWTHPVLETKPEIDLS